MPNVGLPSGELMVKHLMMVMNAVSFYAPMIIYIGIILFSMFTGTQEKAFVYFLWLALITFIRIILMKISPNVISEKDKIPDECLTGVTSMFVPNDITFSTYILSFTMMYFVTPMMMSSTQNKINMMNYGVLAFFIAYIILDLFIKRSLKCIEGFYTPATICDILGGMFLGALISGVAMYGTPLKPYLFINELNSNKEVCSMPSKQQFKCAVYKNGELVS